MLCATTPDKRLEYSLQETFKVLREVGFHTRVQWKLFLTSVTSGLRRSVSVEQLSWKTEEEWNQQGNASVSTEQGTYL